MELVWSYTARRPLSITIFCTLLLLHAKQTVGKPCLTVSDGILHNFSSVFLSNRIPDSGLCSAWLNWKLCVEYESMSGAGPKKNSHPTKRIRGNNKRAGGKQRVEKNIQRSENNLETVCRVYLASDQIWLKSKYLFIRLKEGNEHTVS